MGSIMHPTFVFFNQLFLLKYKYINKRLRDVAVQPEVTGMRRTLHAAAQLIAPAAVVLGCRWCCTLPCCCWLPFQLLRWQAAVEAIAAAVVGTAAAVAAS